MHRYCYKGAVIESADQMVKPIKHKKVSELVSYFAALIYSMHFTAVTFTFSDFVDSFFNHSNQPKNQST